MFKKKLPEVVIDPRTDRQALKQLARETNKEQGLRKLMTRSEYECEVFLNNRDKWEKNAGEEYQFKQFLEYYERHMKKLHEEQEKQLSHDGYSLSKNMND